MPRKSAASFETPTPQLRSARLQPPTSLTKDEREAFIMLVINNKPDHFKPSDAPLLIAYSQVICQLQEASKMIHRGVVFEGKISPWISVQERLIKSMVALSMRLRLSPQARAPNNPTRPARPINAYDQLEVNNGYLDDNLN